MRRKSIKIVTALVMILAGLSIGWLGEGRVKKDGYPLHEITVVCPWVQGGGTDLVLRALCGSAQKELGVPVKVVNRVGENGAVGFRAIKEAKPDGYTLGMVTYELNSLPEEGLLDFTYKDMEPVLMVNADAVALAARADAPYDTVGEFVAYAKKHQGQITIAQATPGSVWHVGAALFAYQQKLDVRFLPFEGTANAVTAAANGYTELVAASVAEAREQVDAGKLKFLGIMDTKRSERYPEVPTFEEQGYDITYYTWRGLMLPLGVDGEVKKRLSEGFLAAVEDEAFTEAMKRQCLDITFLNREEFCVFLEKNYQEVKTSLELLGLSK